MLKKFYLPKDDAGKDLWLQNFKAKLPNYATKYAISAAEMADVAAAAADFSYRLDTANQVLAFSKQWTGYKNSLRDGLAPGADAQVPVAPSFNNAPPQADPGIFARIARLVQRIKGHSAYSEADGQDLQIEGTEHRPDISTMHPDIAAHTGTGGRAGFSWKKQGMDGIAVYKDSGSGFVKYDTDNYPPYDDKAPLPANATTWKYKAIYLQHDEEVGQWSSVISMNVGG